MDSDTPYVHIVREGEYLTLIATNYGIPAKKIWEHPGNSELRQRRKSPNILYPGDRLVIPLLTRKEHASVVDEQHTFEVGVMRQKIRIFMKDHLQNPIANVQYRLWVPGEPEIVGTTDDKGLVEADVPPDCREAKLYLAGEYWDLDVGALDPISRLSGVQQRLNNLGFSCEESDEWGPQARSALFHFQTASGLDPTGVPDDATRKKLEQMHEGASRNLTFEDQIVAPGRVQVLPTEQTPDEAVEPMPPSMIESQE